jgi:hypothetical protein
MIYRPTRLQGMIKEGEIAVAAGRKKARTFLDHFYTGADPRSSAVIAPGLTEHHNGIAHWLQYRGETYTAQPSAQAVGAVATERSRANLIVWTSPQSGSNV